MVGQQKIKINTQKQNKTKTFKKKNNDYVCSNICYCWLVQQKRRAKYLEALSVFLGSQSRLHSNSHVLNRLAEQLRNHVRAAQTG